MEFVDGSELADKLESDLSLKEIKQILHQLLSAVEYLERK